MTVIKLEILGSVNIGNYALATNAILIITGEATDEKISRIAEALGIKAVKVAIRDCRITAPFFIGNKNGLLVSKFIDHETLQDIRRNLRGRGIEVEVINLRYNAIGNLLLVNDQGAVASPLLPSKVLTEVSEILDVEVGVETIGGASYIGSLGVINNHGGLVSPYARDKEIKHIEETLRVKIMRGTVNAGVGFIHSGLIANDRGAAIGEDTDGSELMRISQALGVI